MSGCDFSPKKHLLAPHGTLSAAIRLLAAKIVVVVLVVVDDGVDAAFDVRAFLFGGGGGSGGDGDSDAGKELSVLLLWMLLLSCAITFLDDIWAKNHGGGYALCRSRATPAAKKKAILGGMTFYD